MRTPSMLLVQGIAVFVLAGGAGTQATSRSDVAQLGGGVRNASGKLSLLRVNDVGTRFGPPNDQIDVEVVIRLDSAPTKSFGFQLRADGNQPVRQAMFDLLRDAYQNDWTVSIDYTEEVGRNNSVLFRVWLSR